MNILLTSVGRRGYMVRYFKEALGNEGKVFAANSDVMSPAFCRADDAVVTPLIYDQEYIPFLKRYCQEQQVGLLISLFDIDLPILAAHKEEFREIGVNILVSDKHIIDICNDKWKTFLFLKERGFFVPGTYLEISAVMGKIKKGEMSFPLILKPRWGMGSIGVAKAEDEEELIFLQKRIKREIRESYLKYESEEDYEKCVLIQEYILGQEYGFDIINDLQGKYRNTVIKKKYALRSGETDCAVTTGWEKGRQDAERLARQLKHIGILDVDVFESGGVPYIIDMNARFGGGYPFSHLAGINLPKAMLDWASGRETEEKNLQWKVGVTGHKDIEVICLDVIDIGL